MFADYHMHTEFSDDSILDMETVVLKAIDVGLDEIFLQNMLIMVLSLGI